MKGIRVRRCARAAALASTAFVGVTASAAFAQVSDQPQQTNAASSTPNTSESGLADIVVTAERRATNLQDTPISIVAVTEEVVAAKGIDDIQDLATFTPNLNISANRGNGNNSPIFAIRGIGGGTGATSERGVGFYIDGIYMPRTSGSVLRVLDIDRVEVLRGPQGTLFGRNSTGGAVRLFTRPAQLGEFEGYLRGTLGNFDRHDLVGVVNVPLGDSTAVRVQGAFLEQDGFVNRGTQKLGGSKDYIGRAQLRSEPSDALRFDVGFLYSNSKADGTTLVFKEFDMRPGIEGVIQGNYADWLNDSFKRAGQPPLQPYNDPRLVRGAYTAPSICLLDDFDPDYDKACDQFNDNEYIQADLTATWDLSDKVKITSTNGVSKLNHKGVSDWQLLGTEYRTDDLKSRVIYSELQINSALFNDAVDLVTGGNYFRENATSPTFTINRRGTSVYPATANGDGDLGLFTGARTYTQQISNSFGLFASATWHITDKLNLTGGLRQAWDNKYYLQTRFPGSNNPPLPATDARGFDFRPVPGTDRTTVSDETTFKALDYRATIDYHFTDDAMVYGTISKAYRAGSYSFTVASYNPAVPSTAVTARGDVQSDAILPIPPEKVRNFEVGSRLTLFDRMLRFNPTAFFMQYTNRQAATQVTCGTGAASTLVPGSPACPAGFLPLVTNQGDVDIWGVEIDAQLALSRNLTIDGAFAVTDYKLKDPPAGTVHLYPATPSPTYNVGITYSPDLGFAKTTFNLNYAYIGKQPTHPSEGTDSSYTLPGYSLFNARIQVVPEGSPVTVALFANNLFDNVYGTYAQRFGGGFWDSGAGTGPAAPLRNALGIVRGRPREVGVTVQYNF